MKLKKWAALGATILVAASLSACAAEPVGGNVIAPVTKSVNELQGAEVELLVGQVLNIKTDSLEVDSYSGEVEDTKVAEFTKGRKTASAQFNPGVTALAKGSTKVTMMNEQGGIQNLVFTVKVS